MPMTGESKSLSYRLLTERRFRAVRHSILFLAIFIISVSQNFSRYGSYSGVIGSRIYVLSLFNTAAYLAVAYFHIYRLVPAYLIRKKYARYLLFSILSVASLAGVRFLEDRIVSLIWNVPELSRWDMIFVLDSVSEFTLNMLCITGVSLTVLQKYWLREEAAITELETRRLGNEVEALKDTTDPRMLLSTLHYCGENSASAPDRSAGTLLKLSDLLRYQLYESSKEKVFLHSEIVFLTNYLELEKTRTGILDYTIEQAGDLTRIYVPPLAFIPFVRQALSGQDSLRLQFIASGGNLRFTCNGIGDGHESLQTALHRLKTIYDGRLSYGMDEGLFYIDMKDE